MNISWKIVFHQLKEPFKISHGTYHQRKALIVSIEKEGFVGYGECTEIDYYGIKLDEFEATLEHLKKTFFESEWVHPSVFFTFLESLPLHLFLQSALDCAYWDIYGKMKGETFEAMIGVQGPTYVNSSITISIDNVEEQIRQIVHSSWDCFKIKVNNWTPELRDQLISTSKIIGIDSNGSFNYETCNFIEKDPLSAYFQYFEQPMLPNSQNYSLLKRDSFANWMADEDVKSIDDLNALQNHYSTLNIKVMKCGGLTPSLAIIKKAKELGFKIMMGCMTESTVGISAGIALASFADFLDLDGANLITIDIAQGPQIINGKIMKTNRPGLGIELLP